MSKAVKTISNWWNDRWENDLQKKEFVGAVLLCVVLKLILVATQMIEIFPGGAPLDDELMLSAARSIGEGRWLGTYDWKTIAKSMGFSVWLWLLHTLHIPYLIGNQLLYALASIVGAQAMAPVLKRRWSRLAVFFVLWFSPFSTAQFTLRVYRDSILPAFILLAISSAFAVALRLREGKHGIYAMVAGLASGVALLIRDDVIWIFPFVLAALVLSGVLAGKKHLKRWLISAVALVLAFLAPVLAFCGMNQKTYGVFLINETGDPSFTQALSAMQRADLDLPHAKIAVCKETRDRIYAAVPEAAQLGAVLDGGELYAGYGWPEEEEFNSGGFFWAVKRASFEGGFATNAVAFRTYFQGLADAINGAYETGQLEENPKAGVVSPFVVPFDGSYVMPTLRETGNSLKCLLLFQQTTSLAPLSFASPEQAKEWQDYTYTLPSYIAKANTAEPYYFFFQVIAEVLFTIIRWCYRILIWPALIYAFVKTFKWMKRGFASKEHYLDKIAGVGLLGLLLSIALRVVMISYIEVTNFQIGTYLLYLSGAAVLLVYLAAVGAGAFLEQRHQ